MYKLKFRLLLLVLVLNLSVSAQTIISGIISNEQSKSPISNVHVRTNDGHNSISNMDGFYELEIPNGHYKVSFQHLSFEIKTIEIHVKNSENQIVNIELSSKNEQLETIVLSAGKFEQKIEELSVSLDIINGQDIEYQHNYNIEKKISQAPGIHIIDGQLNIRGGSGWSYGAGSRVLVLLDGLSVTNATTGAVQWELIPAENIENIEIIKGASSVLFGSSALNGVINITSKKPTTTPLTNISAYYGIFDNANRESLNWWNDADINLEEKGFNFNHSRKLKSLSLSFGVQAHKSDGYNGLIDSTFNDNDTVTDILHVGNQRTRLYLNSSYSSRKIKGLDFGINSTYLRFDEADGFIYLSDSLGYTPFSESSFSVFKSAQLSLSPHLSYLNTNNNTKHKFLGRYLQTNFNPTGDQKTNNYIALYSEYLFQKIWLNGRVSLGANLNQYVGLSDFFSDDQKGINYAFFYQYDHTQGPLRFSIGTRFERYNLRDKKEGKPITRIGLNYQLNNRNFFRASVGQGYRYPSMYELFLYKDAGEISIYSNPQLEAETGYSAEIGYKHKLLATDKLSAYIDVAAFHMKFDNMIEYSYGLWGDSTRLNPLGIGFKPINVGQTTISGLDFSILTQGKINSWSLSSQLSYTYCLPKAVNPDEVYDDFDGRIDDLIQSLVNDGTVSADLVPFIRQIAEAQLSPLTFNKTSSNAESEILKYRYEHMVKLNLNIGYGAFSFGTHIQYNSFMKNVDQLFESGVFNSDVNDLFTIADANIYDMGIKSSREKLQDGDIIADFRLSYKLNKNTQLQILVENAMNREYQIRPGSLGPPRMYSIKLSAQF